MFLTLICLDSSKAREKKLANHTLAFRPFNSQNPQIKFFNVFLNAKNASDEVATAERGSWGVSQIVV